MKERPQAPESIAFPAAHGIWPWPARKEEHGEKGLAESRSAHQHWRWTSHCGWVMSNALGPKVAVFYLAALPQFAGTENTAPAIGALLITMHSVYRGELQHGYGTAHCAGHAAAFVSKLDAFARSYKFTLDDRNVAVVLDTLERLIEATYDRDRAKPLAAANLDIEKLRHLFRLVFTLKCIEERRYEHAARSLDEIGRLIVAWKKSSAAFNARAVPNENE